MFKAIKERSKEGSVLMGFLGYLIAFVIGFYLGSNLPKTIEAAKPHWNALVAQQRIKLDNERSKGTR